MQAAHADLGNAAWLVMDCTRMAFPDAQFDVAFDKGTFDALYCGADGVRTVGLALAEVHRVLRPGGLFFEISYGRPDSRGRTFRQFGIDWELLDPISLVSEEMEAEYWIYVFRKGGGNESKQPVSDGV
jgi:ubiquinone/menaquinone biosynthesis C-methylase UbiE